MEIQVELSGGKKVAARFGHYRVETDQPVEDGGQGSAPAPFDLFLASLATCAGFFVQSFCQTRGIPTEEISLTQSATWDEELHRYGRIRIEIRLPPAFPERYRGAVVAAANQCTVKKYLQNPPELEVIATSG